MAATEPGTGEAEEAGRGAQVQDVKKGSESTCPDIAAVDRLPAVTQLRISRSEDDDDAVREGSIAEKRCIYMNYHMMN